MVGRFKEGEFLAGQYTILKDGRTSGLLEVHQEKIASRVDAIHNELANRSDLWIMDDAEGKRVACGTFEENEFDFYTTTLAGKCIEVRASTKDRIAKTGESVYLSLGEPQKTFLTMSSNTGNLDTSVRYDTVDEVGNLALVDGQEIVVKHYSQQVNQQTSKSIRHRSWGIYSAEERTVHWKSGYELLVRTDDDAMVISEDYDSPVVLVPFQKNVHEEIERIGVLLQIGAKDGE
jgi:hypothetical protein